jgi:hypothetical protein
MSPQDESEMNLMCHVLMEDSHWLDTFQASVLSGEVKTKDAGLASKNNPWESREPVEKHFNRKKSNEDNDISKTIVMKVIQRSKSTDSLNSTNFGRRIVTAPLSVVAQLPAPEFVVGTNSVIAAESMRMIAAVGPMHRTGSLGSAHPAADELPGRDPSWLSGTSCEHK